jgi:hypothetical protein
MAHNEVGRWFGLALIAASVAGISLGQAADTKRLPFVTHASFFSAETHQSNPVDPHVFVRDPAAAAAVGPQNIQHVAGIRPALIEQDAKSTPLFNAKGEALGFALGEWLGAAGIVTISPAANGAVRVSSKFSHLRPGGHYSLFENHFDQQPVGFTPLDGLGKANDFVASEDGTAKTSVLAPQALTHANAVLLVYHSDKTSHGDQRGDIGVNAHHQLIARIPQ